MVKYIPMCRKIRDGNILLNNYNVSRCDDFGVSFRNRANFVFMYYLDVEINNTMLSWVNST